MNRNVSDITSTNDAFANAFVDVNLPPDRRDLVLIQQATVTAASWKAISNPI